MPERLECEVLQKVRYINALTPLSILPTRRGPYRNRPPGVTSAAILCRGVISGVLSTATKQNELPGVYC